MRIVSWNIDGLNAALTSKSNRALLTRQTLIDIANMNPDVIALQETKLSELTKKHISVLNEIFPGFKIEHSMSTDKKGYAGTMMLFKDNFEYSAPVISNINEGRVSVLSNETLSIVNVYTPNSGGDLVRHDFRQQWDVDFANHVDEMRKHKNVIVLGDLNVSHKEIDLKNPSTNSMRAGFTKEERMGMDNLLNVGLVDSYRHIHGDVLGAYTWWTQLSKTAKTNNSGWRLDYILVDERIQENIVDAGMVDSHERADHCPIYLDLK